MKNKEIFNFETWEEIIIGIQNNWLDYKTLTNLWDSNNISMPKDKRYADIYWAEQESKEKVLEVVSEFVKKDLGLEIPIDREGLCIDYTLEAFENGMKIWEYHFLYPIYKSDRTISEKLEDDIYYLWCDFIYFNVRWGDFLWISACRLNKNEKELYHDFEKYIHELSSYLSSR